MKRSLKYWKNKRQSIPPINREFKEAVAKSKEEENKTDNLKQQS